MNSCNHFYKIRFKDIIVNLFKTDSTYPLTCEKCGHRFNMVIKSRTFLYLAASYITIAFNFIFINYSLKNVIALITHYILCCILFVTTILIIKSIQIYKKIYMLNKQQNSGR